AGALAGGAAAVVGVVGLVAVVVAGAFELSVAAVVADGSVAGVVGVLAVVAAVVVVLALTVGEVVVDALVVGAAGAGAGPVPAGLAADADSTTAAQATAHEMEDRTVMVPLPNLRPAPGSPGIPQPEVERDGSPLLAGAPTGERLEAPGPQRRARALVEVLESGGLLHQHVLAHRA